jgi:nicotinamide phosphoribosyltransferase
MLYTPVKERVTVLDIVDSYKDSQPPQYPQGTKEIYSYEESRDGAMFPYSVFFGLQFAIKKYLCTPITKEDVDEQREMMGMHYGSDDVFPHELFYYIVSKHGGRLPLSIKAVPEGLHVPTSNVWMTVKPLDEKLFWLSNYLETCLQQMTWYGSTVCTGSHFRKKRVLKHLKRTGDPALIDFKVHDFGLRGSTSPESGGLGGLAHLVNFKGTDNKMALKYGRLYYGEKMAGFSIPASEHSTMTSWGGRDYEVDAFRNMIKKWGHMPLYACVSDSYDIQRACTELWGKELKNDILNAKGTLVVRPDSGIPAEVVTDCLNRLGEAFGFTYNNKDHKVLHPKIRLIQGDGMDYEEYDRVPKAMSAAGWSVDNTAFGEGGGLLQKLNRDTQRVAFKCSSITNENGVERDVFKNPKSGGKTSKKGKMSLVEKNGQLVTVNGENHPNDVMREVFRYGDLLIDDDLTTIRARADHNLTAEM